jgi:hypothetical protein
MIYYNRKRISTINPGGLPPSIFREQSTVTKAVDLKIMCFLAVLKLTFSNSNFIKQTLHKAYF